MYKFLTEDDGGGDNSVVVKRADGGGGGGGDGGGDNSTKTATREIGRVIKLWGLYVFCVKLLKFTLSKFAIIHCYIHFIFLCSFRFVILSHKFCTSLQ